MRGLSNAKLCARLTFEYIVLVGGKRLQRSPKDLFVDKTTCGHSCVEKEKLMRGKEDKKAIFSVSRRERGIKRVIARERASHCHIYIWLVEDIGGVSFF